MKQQGKSAQTIPKYRDYPLRKCEKGCTQDNSKIVHDFIALYTLF